jgi:uncharacterized LabA/DUF88 family protein
MYDFDLLELLITTALKSNMTHKHACVIKYRNKIISTGYNYYKLWNGKIYNNKINDYETNKYSIHAEKDAIQKIKDKSILRDCKIYIIRIKNCNEFETIDNGKKYLNISFSNIEHGTPCSMCCDLLKKYHLNLKKVNF